MNSLICFVSSVAWSSGWSGPSAGALVGLPGGEWVVRFDPVRVAPGEEVVFSLCWSVGC